MSSAIPLGLRHSKTLVVSDSLTVPAVSDSFTNFADMPPVFATALLVAFVESTCIEALNPYLLVSQRTVGTHVNVSHSAATPVGMEVTAEVELIAIDGRRLTFRVLCRDAVDVISEGQHERFVVEPEKFIARTQAKSR